MLAKLAIVDMSIACHQLGKEVVLLEHHIEAAYVGIDICVATLMRLIVSSTFQFRMQAVMPIALRYRHTCSKESFRTKQQPNKNGSKSIHTIFLPSNGWANSI